MWAFSDEYRVREAVSKPIGVRNLFVPQEGLEVVDSRSVLEIFQSYFMNHSAAPSTLSNDSDNTQR